MKKFVWGAVAVFVVIIGAAGAFIYKVTVGWPIFESKPPELVFSESQKNVVVFSKSNGYRHVEGIEAAEILITEMGSSEGWNVQITENGALHTPEILAQADVIIWNNVTGKVLLEEQRLAMKNYIESGGSFIGLHGAGDFSHDWSWYEDVLIGAHFSHHTLNPQLQEGTVYPEGGDPGSNRSWVTMEEWYVFYDSPRESGAKVLWNLHEADIDPNGNLGFLVSDKDWGMGDDHPMIWRKRVGKGKSVYSAFGHDAINYKNPDYQEILKDQIKWALR